MAEKKDQKKVVVAGATGLVGNAALRHFGAASGCEIVALSRRLERTQMPYRMIFTMKSGG